MIATSILIVYLCSALAHLRAWLNHSHQLVLKKKRQRAHPPFYSSEQVLSFRHPYSSPAGQPRSHAMQLHSARINSSWRSCISRCSTGPRTAAELPADSRAAWGAQCAVPPRTDPAPSSPLPSVGPAEPLLEHCSNTSLHTHCTVWPLRCDNFFPHIRLYDFKTTPLENIYTHTRVCVCFQLLLYFHYPNAELQLTMLIWAKSNLNINN